MSMAGGSDFRPGVEFAGEQLLAQDKTSSAPHSHGMTTWQGSSWGL